MQVYKSVPLTGRMSLIPLAANLPEVISAIVSFSIAISWKAANNMAAHKDIILFIRTSNNLFLYSSKDRGKIVYLQNKAQLIRILQMVYNDFGHWISQQFRSEERRVGKE